MKVGDIHCSSITCCRCPLWHQCSNNTLTGFNRTLKDVYENIKSVMKDTTKESIKKELDEQVTESQYIEMCGVRYKKLVNRKRRLENATKTNKEKWES